jgi:hypothetical protein
LAKLQICLAKFYQATTTKKASKIKEAVDVANRVLSEYDTFYRCEMKRALYLQKMREQHAIDVEKVMTVPIKSVRAQAMRSVRVYRLDELRSHVAHFFGQGQNHKAKKVLGKADKLQKELQEHCDQQQCKVEPGFMIDPDDFNQVISKLEKSEDPLF